MTMLQASWKTSTTLSSTSKLRIPPIFHAQTPRDSVRNSTVQWQPTQFTTHDGFPLRHRPPGLLPTGHICLAISRRDKGMWVDVAAPSPSRPPTSASSPRLKPPMSVFSPPSSIPLAATAIAITSGTRILWLRLVLSNWDLG